jgi:hypothetical protein
MTRNELTRRFPKASEAFIRANCSAAPELERGPSDEPLEKKEVQGPVSNRFLVRVTAVRKRLLDEDNLCAKYHVDLCRYSGVIPDDAPGQCQIETRQRKAEKGEQEHSVVEVFTVN